MSSRNMICEKCGTLKRSELMAGPRCGAKPYPMPCPKGCGPMIELKNPKNRKPAVAPDGRRRRHE